MLFDHHVNAEAEADHAENEHESNEFQAVFVEFEVTLFWEEDGPDQLSFDCAEPYLTHYSQYLVLVLLVVSSFQAEGTCEKSVLFVFIGNIVQI